MATVLPASLGSVGASPFGALSVAAELCTARLSAAFFVIRLIRASAAAAATPSPPAGGCLVVLGSFGVSRPALLLGLFVEQGLTVGDRDLIVVGMYFSEGQEAVAIAAVIHESRLQRRLNARHLGKIDIAS